MREDERQAREAGSYKILTGEEENINTKNTKEAKRTPSSQSKNR
jgi:hypothetical protein